jgi:opacity protein-like surface antigen
MMKYRSLKTLGAALGALLIASAANAQESTYLKGELGGSFGGEYENGGTAELDSGFRYGVGVGTGLTSNMRLEAELFRDEADFDSGGGASEATVGMANLYYDFGDVSGFTPFVGAGAGYGKFDADGAEDESWAYQLTAGASTPLGERLTGELAYKYVAAPDLEFAGTGVDYNTSAITAGLRYKFGG